MKYLFYLLLILSCNIAVAQNSQIDSLQKELSTTTRDSSRALILSELAFQYLFANADTAMRYAQQALTLSRQINYKRGEASAMNHIAFLYREKGNLPVAMELHLKVMQIARDYNLDNEGGLSMVRLGNIYRDLKDYSTALNYQRQGLLMFKRTNDKRGIAIAEMLIGQTFQEKNQLDSAMYHEELAKIIVDTFNFPNVKTTLLNIIGRIQSKLGNYHLALNYYRQCAEISMHINDHRTGSLVYSNMAQVFVRLKQTDSAISYAGKGLAIAEQTSNKSSQLYAATILSEIYEPLDIRKAFDYHKIAAAAKDSLYSSEKLQALQTLTYNEQERQRNIESAKATYRSQIRQYGLMAGAAVFLLIAIILYRNNLQKQKTNKFLESTLANLKSTQAQLVQSEKMAWLGGLTAGIAHEIQNPLNFVNNFSEVSNELIDEMKSELATGNQKEATIIANDIKQNLEKINHHGKRAGSIVKNMLEHSRSGTGQKELADINALADEYLRLSYYGMKAKDKSFNVDLQTDFDPGVGKINIVTQDISRVLLNLYNNALYAVKEKQKSADQHYNPVILVSTRRNGDKTEIRVKDNGIGVPQQIADKIFQPFFTTKPAGQGTGLGLSLSYDLIKAHGGEIKMSSASGQWTEFIIII